MSCRYREPCESKAISSLSVYMYFANISVVNSGVREANAHVYYLVNKSLIPAFGFLSSHYLPKAGIKLLLIIYL